MFLNSLVRNTTIGAVQRSTVYTQSSTQPTRKYGGDGSGSLRDKTSYALSIVNDFNPFSNAQDALNYLFWGTDRFGNRMSPSDATLAVIGAIPFGNIEVGLTKQIAAKGGVVVKGLSVIGPRATYREFAKKIGANFLDVTDEAWTMRKNVAFLQTDCAFYIVKFIIFFLNFTHIFYRIFQF